MMMKIDAKEEKTKWNLGFYKVTKNALGEHTTPTEAGDITFGFTKKDLFGRPMKETKVIIETKGAVRYSCEEFMFMAEMVKAELTKRDKDKVGRNDEEV